MLSLVDLTGERRARLLSGHFLASQSYTDLAHSSFSCYVLICSATATITVEGKPKLSPVVEEVTETQVVTSTATAVSTEVEVMTVVEGVTVPVTITTT